MRKLLEELQKVDIDLWREIQGFRIHPGGPELTLCDDRLLDHIQGACQRAIAARPGWTYQVQNYNRFFHIAYVVGDGREESAQADFPAKAILAAYVAAMRSQPCPS